MTISRLGLFCALIIAAVQAKAADHCVVLQYHHISEETPGITSVTPDLFQQHLDYLLVNKYEVLAVEDVVETLKDGGELPDRCVALTIDDAYLSSYTEAFPRTQRYAFPLTVFISTEAVDNGYSSHLNWQQVREMQAGGVSFQNHGHQHIHLIRRTGDEDEEDWEQRVATDIQTAQNRIIEMLGETPTLFAYPFGEYNDALRGIVRSMGLDAFGQQSGPMWGAADFTALPRFPMASLYASMRTFPNKLNSQPLPITGAFPTEPVVPIDEWQPSLTLVFRPEVSNTQSLTCYMNGSPEVTYEWLDQPAGGVIVTPKGRLNVGRNRTNCTLPGDAAGRFGWYSHNWIRREGDGSWYRERR